MNKQRGSEMALVRLVSRGACEQFSRSIRGVRGRTGGLQLTDPTPPPPHVAATAPQHHCEREPQARNMHRREIQESVPTTLKGPLWETWDMAVEKTSE